MFALIMNLTQSDYHMADRAMPLWSNTTEPTSCITHMHAVYCMHMTHEEHHTAQTSVHKQLGQHVCIFCSCHAIFVCWHFVDNKHWSCNTASLVFCSSMYILHQIAVRLTCIYLKPAHPVDNHDEQQTLQCDIADLHAPLCIAQVVSLQPW